MATRDWYGYVYLLQCGTQFKIGFSKHPRKRVRQFRTGSPHDVYLLHTLKAPHYRNVEKQLHREFAAKRGSGEWFHLDADDVGYIKSLNAYGKTPEELKA